MSTIHAARKRQIKARRRAVRLAARLEHEARVERLAASGNIDKIRNSAFIRKHMKRIKDNA